MERVLQDAARLSELRESGLLDRPLSEVLDGITRTAASLLKAPAAFVALVDSYRDFYLSQFGFGEPLASTRELTGQTFCHFTVSGGRTLVIPDTRADPVYRSVPTVESLGIAAYLGVPLRLGTGPVIGSFCVIDTEPHAWSASEIELVEELAKTAVREMETLRRDIVAEAENAEGPGYP